MESIARDPVTKDPLQQIVPNKTRCGSTDPLEMNEETKCYCYTKDDRGSSKLFFFRIVISKMYICLNGTTGCLFVFQRLDLGLLLRYGIFHGLMTF